MTGLAIDMVRPLWRWWRRGSEYATQNSSTAWIMSMAGRIVI